jgi:hypothetical protein
LSFWPACDSYCRYSWSVQLPLARCRLLLLAAVAFQAVVCLPVFFVFRTVGKTWQWLLFSKCPMLSKALPAGACAHRQPLAQPVPCQNLKIGMKSKACNKQSGAASRHAAGITAVHKRYLGAHQQSSEEANAAHTLARQYICRINTLLKREGRGSVRIRSETTCPLSQTEPVHT